MMIQLIYEGPMTEWAKSKFSLFELEVVISIALIMYFLQKKQDVPDLLIYERQN